jgi:hypothetical protein
MEFVRQLGGNPLSLVTELPLFIVRFKNRSPEESSPGNPAAYLTFKEKLPDLRRHCEQGKSIDELTAPYEITPLPLSTALNIQFQTIEAALTFINNDQ